jgi:hypothetical protein
MFLSAGTRHRIIFKVFENDRLLSLKEIFGSQTNTRAPLNTPLHLVKYTYAFICLSSTCVIILCHIPSRILIQIKATYVHTYATGS